MHLLFICEGNINRSQMAAAFAEQMLPDAEVVSAGTLVPPSRDGRALSETSTDSIDTMKEIGIDMSGAVVTLLTPQMMKDADRVVLLGPTPGGPIPDFLKDSSKLMVWDVPDPGYGQISVTAARDMIGTLVRSIVEA